MSGAGEWIRRHWIVALSLGAVALVVVTHRDFGPTWDEAAQARYGELVVRYFASGLSDTRANELQNLHLYGPLVEVVAALLYANAPDQRYEIRHLFVGLLAVGLLPALFLVARRAGRRGLPWFAVLATLTLPRLVGHAFANSKDVPFALGIAWSMVALLRAFAERDHPWRNALACGAAFGLTLCVRPGGLGVLAAYAAGVAALAFATGVRPWPQRSEWTGGLARAGAAFAVAWIAMVLPWPWAHAAPVANPLHAIAVAPDFAATYPVLFEGVTVSSRELPASYLPKYLAITTPPATLALALVGLVSGLAARPRRSPASFVFGVALLWLALPLGFAVVARPNVYDGLRHFLFVLPAVGLLAGFGAAWIQARPRSPRGRAAAGALCTALLLLPALDLVRLHPYQATYFNGLVGGVAGAEDRYETDYWLTSYREALEWVNRRAAERPDATIRVVVAGDKYILPWVRHYAAKNVRASVASTPSRAAELPEGIDYYVATRRYGYHHAFPRAPIVHRVGRAGAVFTVVKGRSAREGSAR